MKKVLICSLKDWELWVSKNIDDDTCMDNIKPEEYPCVVQWHDIAVGTLAYGIYKAVTLTYLSDFIQSPR